MAKDALSPISPNHGVTFCGECGKVIQVRDSVATEHNIVLALRTNGIDAAMQQTDGMTIAARFSIPMNQKSGFFVV
jgi:hypothetical protein